MADTYYFTPSVAYALLGLAIIGVLVVVVILIAQKRPTNPSSSTTTTTSTTTSTTNLTSVASKKAAVAPASFGIMMQTSAVNEYATKLHPSTTYKAPCFEDHSSLQMASNGGSQRQYIVLYKEDKVQPLHVKARCGLFQNAFGFQVHHQFDHINRGFSATLDRNQLDKIRSDTSIQEIHSDVIVRASPVVRRGRHPPLQSDFKKRMNEFVAQAKLPPPRKAPPKPAPIPPPPPKPVPVPVPPPPKPVPTPVPPPVNPYPASDAVYGWNITRVGITPALFKAAAKLPPPRNPAPAPPKQPAPAPPPAPNASVPAVDVYIVDTGIDIGHANLNVAEAKSFVIEEMAPGDLNGHGTFCAGIVGARGISQKVIGVLPNVRLHGLKVLNASGSGTFSSIIAALNYIYSVKLANPSQKMVVSMSLGAAVNTPKYNILDTTIVQLINAKIPVVIAAGNDAVNAEGDTPAHVVEALTVGAYDKNNKFASFSNFGPVVDILAPGVDVTSTWKNNSYYSGSGTSFSCPHATGLAARYLANNPMPATVSALWTILKNVGAASPLISNVPSGTTRTSVYTF